MPPALLTAANARQAVRFIGERLAAQLFIETPLGAIDV